MESRRLLATIPVTTTADIGPGSLRAAIVAANTQIGPDNIVFNIPATTGNQDAPGFDRTTQTWRIQLNSPLPPLTDQVTIDGLTQANFPIPYRYPAQNSPDPTQIVSSASTVAAKDGNNAVNRIIIDGQNGEWTGFDIRAPHCIVRGLNIVRFQIGVSISGPDAVGAVVQGNSIGRYFVYPVDTQTGEPLPGAAAARLDDDFVPSDPTNPGNFGNSGTGILVGASNATIGGRLPQEGNIIAGNRLHGVWVLTDAVGNLIAGNQIGLAGPTTNGLFTVAGNGADGIRIESLRPDIFAPPNTSSSTTVDVNLISANRGNGINVIGPVAGQASTRINITGNYIGVGPGGGFAFGSPDTGNLGNGIWIQNAGVNRIGGSSDRDRNVIAANEGAGIWITGMYAVDNVVSGNNIGVTASGDGALGNSREGVILNAPNNTVGPGNLISANLRGVFVVSTADIPATGNTIRDNLIGTESTGQFDLGNAIEGVRIENATDTRVVGNAAGSQVISGNNVGVLIVGSQAQRNTVQGNFIGTTSSGTSDLGNSLEGVRIENAPNNTVGGTTTAARNLISANHWGVTLTGAGTQANLIQGNLIGTDLSGNLALGNELQGVLIESSAGNTIGGTIPGARNVISGNQQGGLTITGAGSSANLVQGNFIGVGISGSASLGNEVDGIWIAGAARNTIGGTTAAAQNVISANQLSGLRITDAGSASNVVLGNLIGTDVTGISSLGNGFDGVLIQADASGNRIGDDALAAGNSIAFNGRDGVRVEGLSVGNAILTNRIFQNGWLGINLVSPNDTEKTPRGNVTPNDPGDADVGPNLLQNFPVISSVNARVGSTQLVGTLNSRPNVRYLIQFFVTVPPSLDSVAQGDSYLGETTVTTDAAGNASFSVDFPVVVTASQAVTATATDSFGNTSEFSGATLGPIPTVSFAMADYTIAEAGGQATLIVTRSGDTTGTVTVNYATADGTARAGLDYQPTSGTLTFAPGVTSLPITIPILLNLEVEGTETVLLNLSNPTGGAVLGRPASAVVSILDDTTDRSGPTVVSARAVAGRLGVAAVILTFNEPLDPARAVNLVNYGYSVRIAGRDGRLGTRDDLLIGIASASYDPTTQTVTLLLGRPILKKTAMRVAINQATDVASAGVGVSDVTGNLLDGDGDGRPGGAYVTKVVARPVPTSPVKRPRVGKAHHHRG